MNSVLFRPRVAMLTVLALIVSLLVVLTPNAAHAATVNETEDNGSTAKSNVVRLGDTVRGTTQRSSSFDDDYFAIDVPTAGKLGLNFTFPTGLAGSSNQYTLYVRDASGSTLYSFDVVSSDADGKRIANTAMYLPAGRFYVHVLGYSSRASWGKTYNLTTNVAPGAVETEDNNATARADVFALGTKIAGSIFRSASSDDDYFAFDAPAAGKLGLNFTFPVGLAGSSNQYQIRVRDASGAIVYDFDVVSSDADGKRLAATAMYLPAGRFYVQVLGYPSRDSWGKAYSLTATVTPTVAEIEDNGSTARANTFGLGAKIAGSTFRNSSYDDDFYAFDVPSAGKLGLNFTFPAALAGADNQYQLRVRNASGSTLYDFDLKSADSDGKRLAATAMYLPAGRFFVQVLGYQSRASWGKAYSLTATVAPGTVEIEDNSSTGQASAVALGAKVSGSTFRNSSYDNDFFIYNVPAAGAAKLTFTFPAGLGAGKLYDLTVLDAAGKSLYDWDLTAANAGGETVASTRLSLPAGNVYVRVIGSSSTSSWGEPYDLTLAMEASSFSASPVPTISGSALAGQTLSAVSGTWGPAPVTLSYAWLRDGAVIGGATAATYKLTNDDVDRLISVQVTGVKAGYTSISRVSAAVMARDAASFLDVSRSPLHPTNSQFWAQIRWMATSGLSTGYPVAGGKEYRPWNSVTRDAMAAFLYRYAKSPAFTPPAVSPFVDVATTHPFYKEIAWMADRGYSTGYDIGGGLKEFRPDLAISRDAMAAFLYRYKNSPAFTPPAVSPFVDVPTNYAFYKEIAWLNATGVSTGWVVGSVKEFRPWNSVTRDAMAAFLNRLK